MNVRQRLAQTAINLTYVMHALDADEMEDEGMDGHGLWEELRIAKSAIESVRDDLRGTEFYDEEARRVELDGPLWPSGGPEE